MLFAWCPQLLASICSQEAMQKRRLNPAPAFAWPLALRVSNPKTWGFAGWAAEIISHLVYGLVTVITYEALYSAEGR